QVTFGRHSSGGNDMKSVKQLWIALPAAIAMMLALPGAMAAVHVPAAGDSTMYSGSGASGAKNGAGDTATQPGSAQQPGSGSPGVNKTKRPTDGGSPTEDRKSVV